MITAAPGAQMVHYDRRHRLSARHSPQGLWRRSGRSHERRDGVLTWRVHLGVRSERELQRNALGSRRKLCRYVRTRC
jgi:hypothetical protein